MNSGKGGRLHEVKRPSDRSGIEEFPSEQSQHKGCQKGQCLASSSSFPLIENPGSHLENAGLPLLLQVWSSSRRCGLVAARVEQLPFELGSTACGAWK
eukprot:1148786-Pelagomonas_calceolata.AAC.3